VVLIDQLKSAWDLDENVHPPTYGKFYDLVRELAEADAFVTVRYPKGVEPREIEAGAMALFCRWRDAHGARHWPEWWDDMLDAKHARRRELWMTHEAYELGILDRERGCAA
jgi:hypothetical protein